MEFVQPEWFKPKDTDEDEIQEIKSSEYEGEDEIDYNKDFPVMKVVGYALMPGVYIGQNGLEAQYSHEVIWQDGLDLTGRPVGQMHEKDNAGYVHTVEIDEITAKQMIYTEIYDSEAQEKIRNKEYTGFSIDTKVWGYYQGSRFIVKKIDFRNGRVDLVDRPACQECLFLSVEEPTSTVQQEIKVTHKDECDMTDEVTISKERLESLLKAEKDLEQEKIKQAAKVEADIVKLVKEIKVKHATFSAEDYLKVATTSEQKVAMLEALNMQLGDVEIEDDKAEDINSPPTQVTQSAEPRPSEAGQRIL